MKSRTITLVAIILLPQLLNAAALNFTNASFSALDHQHVYAGSIDSATYTITAGTTASGYSNPLLIWGPDNNNPGDGLGVTNAGGWLEHQIEAPEYIEILFNKEIFLTSFSVSDLYYNESGWYNEVGRYSLDGGAYTNFQALVNSSNGQHTFTVNQMVTRIRWTSMGLLADGSNHEYGLTVVNVQTPEPATIIVLATGAATAAMARRRKRMQQQA